MPYQSEVYQPPAIPPALITTPAKTFDDLRNKITGIVNYLQLLNSSDITYFAHLQENVNQNATTEGLNIPVATTISVYKFMHVLTGNGAVQTIKPPLGYSGQLMLISRDGFELVSGGNISMIQSPNVLPPNTHILLTWVPSRNIWFADSCRLQGTGGGTGGGGGTNGVLVTPALAGPGIHIDPATYVITNTGVLSLIAGANISLSGSTGNITISATGGGGGTALPWTITTTATTPYSVGSGFNAFVRGSATAGADQVVNLPAATGTGWMALVKKMDTNPHNIVVTRAGTDTIDGLSTYTLTNQYSAVQLVDGATGLWDVVNVKP
jgi:hypothetical protein